MFLTSAQAQTWDNGGSGNNWTTGNNWNPNGAPANNGTADLTFQGLGFFGSGSTNSNVNVAYNVNSISYGGSFGTHTIGGQPLTIQSSVTNNAFIVGAVFNNTVVLNSSTTWNAGALSAITTNGNINGTGGLNKTGAGTMTLNGGGNFSGTVTVSGGTLLLGASNAIGDSADLDLSGGTFSVDGNSDTLDGLTLSGNSTLDMGAGGSLYFTSASHSSGELTISNWTRDSDQIVFTNKPTDAFLRNTFWSDSGIRGSLWLADTGQIVPVPEASTYVMGGLLIGAVLVYHRRRVRRNKV